MRLMSKALSVTDQQNEVTRWYPFESQIIMLQNGVKLKQGAVQI